MDWVMIAVVAVVVGIVVLLLLPGLAGMVLPMRYLGLKRLIVELRKQGIRPEAMGDACLRDLLEKAEGGRCRTRLGLSRAGFGTMKTFRALL